jgi:hypothetical protein
MGQPSKMVIYAYMDEKFERDTGKSFEVQVNPSTINYSKKIKSSYGNALGVQNQTPEYAFHDPVSFQFETLLDSTGAVTDSGDIPQQINELEQVVYEINGEIHTPNYLKVSWGSFIFKGGLVSLDYKFTLFASSGKPLRVNITFNLIGYMDKWQAAKQANLQSPDLSRVVELKADESIPFWCNEIYGDATYCTDIARINGLAGIKDVKPGTRLTFPALVR